MFLSWFLINSCTIFFETATMKFNGFGDTLNSSFLDPYDDFDCMVNKNNGIGGSFKSNYLPFNQFLQISWARPEFGSSTYISITLILLVMKKNRRNEEINQHPPL